MSERKLLILDVNGVLCKITYDDEGILITYREGINEFLEWCFDNYDVGIYSSSDIQTINNVINMIDPNMMVKFKFIWDRSRVEYDPNFINSHKTIKVLDRIWNNPIINENRTYNKYNTLIVDDCINKLRYNNHKNCLIVPSFNNYKIINLPTDLKRIKNMKSDINIKFRDMDDNNN